MKWVWLLKKLKSCWYVLKLDVSYNLWFKVTLLNGHLLLSEVFHLDL